MEQDRSVNEIDADLLGKMTRYYGSDPRIAREVTDEVLNESDGEWTLQEFIDLIMNTAANIPAECISSAKVSLEPGDDDYRGKLLITYDRMETAEEVNSRVTSIRYRVLDVMSRNRAEYERLKSIFEPST